ncbi:MAG: oligosaccharide repeat unit polymerase [Bacteroidetes bacterium]|nr:oligosaccharide repeat unit polymerase [Bacteroidota bacterium]MBU1680590.1 oligosaccharide repeat unit polymerase [Bacteroidota bacterium]
MSLISIISFTVFFGILLSSFRKGAELLSPAKVFALIWTLAIGLAELKLSRLQSEWDIFSWFMLLIGVLFFLLGNYIAYVINSHQKFIDLHNVRSSIRSIKVNEKLLYSLILVFFIIFSVSFLTEYLIEGYLPIFTAQPDKARKMFGVFGIHLLVNGVNIILFLIAEYFILIKGKTSKKILLSVVFLISLSSFFLLLQRYNIFLLGVMIFGFLYYSGKHIRFRTFLIAFLIMAGLVVLIRTVRIAQFAEYYFYATSKMKFPIKYAFLSEPYMYIVMNLENFVENFDKIQFHTYGLFTADFITALAGIKHWVADYLNVDKFEYFISGYNTFPYFWAYYFDYGMMGLAAIPLILGFSISEIYYRLHRMPNLVNLTLYSIGFVIIVISFSSDPLTRLDMVFNFVVIAIVQYFISFSNSIPQYSGSKNE